MIPGITAGILVGLVIWLVCAIARRPPPVDYGPCKHRFLDSRRWFKDDTPMAAMDCPECGYHDEGPVHADPATWMVGYCKKCGRKLLEDACTYCASFHEMSPL